MNVFGKRERSWRKAHKRGVSPIIATILLVAITVVLAAVLYVLISGLTKGPGSTPIGSAFGFGTAVQASSTPSGTCTAGDVCYSIGIASASSSVTTATVNFALQSGGSPVSGWHSVTLVSLTGTVLACYNSGGWFTTVALGVCGATALTSATAFSSTQTLILDSGSTTPIAGYNVIAAGVGSLQGTTSVSLP